MKLKKATSYSLHALMYMTRHLTQLPVNMEVISKAEGIPQSYLSRIFQKLSEAGIVKAKSNKGYDFGKPPGEIYLKELFELMEGGSLFDECFMDHCRCGAGSENCHIYAAWIESTRKMSGLLAETSLAEAAWNHPEHRFNELPSEGEQKKVNPPESVK